MSKTEVKVPAMGESISEAILSRWLKKSGSFVTQDEPLAELETDKITLEVPAPISGVLGQIFVEEGAKVRVGVLLAEVAPQERAHGNLEADFPDLSQDSQDYSRPMMPTLTSQMTLLPSAQKLINETGIDPQNLVGTGKGGRITKADVLQVLSEPVKHSLPPSHDGAVEVSKLRTQRVPMSKIRKKIAENLKKSQNTSAILTTFNEIDMSRVVNLRERFKDIFEKKYQVKLGFMSFFVRACILALKEIPIINAQIDGNDILFQNFYNIGIAVSTSKGLIVPVLREADQMSFTTIEKNIGHFRLKAQEGTLTVSDITGGTFTISNGGVYGSLMSTPILNDPQSAILGIHKIQERPIVADGCIQIRPMMYVALSYDHRLIDGKDSVTFLVRVKESIEDPERLMLEV